MKILLFLFTIGLGVLTWHQQRELETAQADLQKEHAQLEQLQQRVAQTKSAAPDLSGRALSPEAVGAASGAPAGQWMWEKRTSPLDMAKEVGDRGGHGGRKGPR